MGRGRGRRGETGEIGERQGEGRGRGKEGGGSEEAVGGRGSS